MTSITAQNLGAVAASAEVSQNQKANTQARLANPTFKGQEIPNQIQATAQVAAVVAKPDKERAPSVQKNVDGGFGPQENKTSQKKRLHKKNGKQLEEIIEQDNTVDVVA